MVVWDRERHILPDPGSCRSDREPLDTVQLASDCCRLTTPTNAGNLSGAWRLPLNPQLGTRDREHPEGQAERKRMVQSLQCDFRDFDAVRVRDHKSAEDAVHQYEVGCRSSRNRSRLIDGSGSYV